MANIEVSKIWEAILRNKALASHILERLSNVTPEEEAKGELVITYYKGSDEKKLVLGIGPTKERKRSTKPELV
jgi:hypothetical protein